MLVTSPLKFNEAEVRSFAEKYIMSLESEYLFHAGHLQSITDEERRKELEDRVFKEADLLEKYHDPYVLDVGAGRISFTGTISPILGHKIILRACDALAVSYNTIISFYGLKPYVRTEFAFVERLTDKYPENSFDIVRMRNALDHCYDPFMGVFEMLRVARKGGTVRLIHVENEAENERYGGMHQWNITSRGSDSMLIWRKDFSVDIKDILGDAVKVSTTVKPRDDGYNPGTNMVYSDIIKLDDIEILVKEGMNVLDETMITFCLMKNSRNFSSAYKKVFHRSPFTKSLSERLHYLTASIKKRIPQWLKRPAKLFLHRIGH